MVVCCVIFIFFILCLTTFFLLKYGMTALHYAAWKGFEQIVEILVEHGSNVERKTKVFIFFLICELLDCGGWGKWGRIEGVGVVFFLKLSFLFLC